MDASSEEVIKVGILNFMFAREKEENLLDSNIQKSKRGKYSGKIIQVSALVDLMQGGEVFLNNRGIVDQVNSCFPNSTVFFF